ncbi:accessory Sec system translocase SecA2 [Rossellomorea sp. KS-H15a]|uniref:accessory Sec system translocase SecA2 n=1 Tax=Rossellomorea sp. KS-H15a TaxID=2963940 RepID=UPI0020C658DC|nr:accessory Sec system translocase SecA2 [Rossellomorea sp. KS-H15a]UTE77356.1 accessory Sec system translocase SecA2 [Rossellomorea sp. KS-H15a]
MLTYMKQIIGNSNQKLIKKYQKEVEQINQLESEYASLSDTQLQAKTAEFKRRLQEGATVFEIRVEAFAVVREASKRLLGMRHFDVQLAGGLVLSEGNIAEMPTGEGKTLVASLASYLRALEGKGVHVITVNEYLADRDKNLIGQIHEYLGLRVGINLPGLDPEQKKKAYEADITYGIGSEFGFDYLRDNMAYSLEQKVQKPYHYAIIDEVDSVLIDEAKTPLIIAGKDGVSANLSRLCAQIIKGFKEDVHYLFDIETKSTNMTEEGISFIEQGFNIENLYDIEHQTLYHYVIQALRARVMFQRDIDYIVHEGKVLLVDMFTGRPMEGRTLGNGLHQAIEAKEGLEVTEENKTQASITIQNFFRMYPILCGMTGTAKTEEKEFEQLYGMNVVQIPTNNPIIREDLANRIFLTTEAKYNAVAKKVIELHQKGQPVLIGTTSILQSEAVSEYLKGANLKHNVLNAKSVEQEVTLISLAGQRGMITVATNMAGRGTDIMLGDGVKELGGLYVIGTELHESRRIDNQLKGRSGRQGDPGTSEFFISLEDEMFHRFAKDDLEKILKTIKANDLQQVTSKKVHEFADRVQRICEGSNFSVREYNLKLDDVLNIQRNTIYELRNNLVHASNITEIIKNMLSSYIQEEIERCCPDDQKEDKWDLHTLEKQLLNVLPFSTLSLSGAEDVNKKELNTNIEIELDHYLKTVTEHLHTETFINSVKGFLLSLTDAHWLEHIDAMERLKEGIGLRSFSQEDPMRQYAREGLEMFSNMHFELSRDVSRQLAELISKLGKSEK